jgi:menaquinol-cytochrome c reductase iron-sulfur subunit
MRAKKQSRRKFMGKLSASLIGLGLFGQAAAYFRSLIPNVLYEPSLKFKVGIPEKFPEGVKFLDEKRLYIFKERDSFHAISAICSHLGCTVKHSPFSRKKEVEIKGELKIMQGEFKCPCHGSSFHGDGTNYSGPAPSPLAWHPLEIAQDDGQIVVDMSKKVDRDFRLIV